jgi:hypothetical protein
LKVPPTIGMTVRSRPLGTAPSENLLPSFASVLYTKVMVGGAGVFWVIVMVTGVVSITREKEKGMLPTKGVLLANR